MSSQAISARVPSGSDRDRSPRDSSSETRTSIPADLPPPFQARSARRRRVGELPVSSSGTYAFPRCQPWAWDRFSPKTALITRMSSSTGAPLGSSPTAAPPPPSITRRGGRALRLPLAPRRDERAACDRLAEVGRREAESAALRFRLVLGMPPNPDGDIRGRRCAAAAGSISPGRPASARLARNRQALQRLRIGRQPGSAEALLFRSSDLAEGTPPGMTRAARRARPAT